METENYIQMGISENRNISDIVIVLNKILVFGVDCFEYPVIGSKGSVLCIEYGEGFPIGLGIHWPTDIPLEVTYEDIARSVSKSLNVDVLIEAGEEGTDWLLARPDGLLKKVEVVDLDDGYTWKELELR